MSCTKADYIKNHSRSIYTRNYPSEEENQLIWGQAGNWSDIQPQELIYEYTMASVFGRVGYSYDDRYFVVGSIRRDASSKLPTSSNYDWFPSVSGSWKISSEKFFQNSPFNNIFDLVKLRAGWGKVGNVDLYPNNVSSVEVLNYTWPIILGKDLNNLQSGSYLSTIPNLNATWETTVQTSAGLDITLFDKKLDLGIDWYNKETKDLIDFVPTPAQLGVRNSPMGNMGEVVNRGWEFSASYNGSTLNNKLKYNIWGMFSTNKGYVREYGARDNPVRHDQPNLNSTSILYSDAGYPWYSYMVYKTAGIFRSEDQINKYIYKSPETGEAKVLMPNAKVGDIIYVDTNNDGQINDDDKYFAGSYTVSIR